MVDVTVVDVVLAVMILAAVILIAVAYALFKRLVKAMKLLAIGILFSTAIVVLIIVVLAACIFLL